MEITLWGVEPRANCVGSGRLRYYAIEALSVFFYFFHLFLLSQTSVYSIGFQIETYKRVWVDYTKNAVALSLSSSVIFVKTMSFNYINYVLVFLQNVDHKLKFRSKKGGLPFVELNGEEIADSIIILRELSQKFNKDLDAGLTSEQRSVSHAMISMIENHLVWVVTCWRTKNFDQVLKGYKVNLQHVLGSRIPNGILNFLFKLTYGRKVNLAFKFRFSTIVYFVGIVCAFLAVSDWDFLQGVKKVKAQGMGMHTPEEVSQFGCADLKVLSDMLADKPFFFGDEPTTVCFLFLSQLYLCVERWSSGLEIPSRLSLGFLKILS